MNSPIKKPKIQLVTIKSALDPKDKMAEARALTTPMHKHIIHSIRITKASEMMVLHPR